MPELDRCPSCGASVPVGAAWCSLCFADLRPAPEPPAAPDPTPEVSAPDSAAEGSPPVDRSTRADADADADAAPGAGTATGTSGEPGPSLDAMLAELAAAETARTPAVLGRFSSRGTRVAVMIVGVLVLSLVLVGVIWVLGVLL
jgi:cobalamin biosynthesis Mg chelatase CobN